MTEVEVPQNWHAIVSSDKDSMISYLDHYRAMSNPSLQPLPGEGPDCARLCSSTFSGLADYEDVLTEARELAEILTGVLRTRQNVAQLSLKHIVGVFADGSSKNFPPYGRPVSFRIIAGPMSFIKRDEVIETFEKSAVLFALRTTNPYVREVLRESTRSQDWSNLYRIMETIILDLNENDPMQKKDGRDKVARLGRLTEPEYRRVTESELDSFYKTADSYRHRRPRQTPRTMDLDEAQNLVGRVIEAWLREVARRRP